MSDSKANNRRRLPRLAPRRTTRAACLRGAWGLGRNIALAVLDISESGVRLHVKEPLVQGQQVEVALECLQIQRPAKLAGVVMWCTSAEDGTYTVGVQLEKHLAYSLLQSLTTH